MSFFMGMHIFGIKKKWNKANISNKGEQTDMRHTSIDFYKTVK